jgi:hypothetical protein
MAKDVEPITVALPDGTKEQFAAMLRGALLPTLAVGLAASLIHEPPGRPRWAPAW